MLAYLVLSINTYLETHVFGTFTLGYGRLGPTEARLALIVLNTALARGPHARRPRRAGGAQSAPPRGGGAGARRRRALRARSGRIRA